MGAHAKGGAPRLSVRGISKSFSGNQVLAGIDLDIYPGELVALLGENGAGKSTFSSIIAGLIQPDAGTMQWEGRPYAPTRPGDAIDTGIVLIHQEMRLLPDLTIAENVFVGRLADSRGSHRSGNDEPSCGGAASSSWFGHCADDTCSHVASRRAAAGRNCEGADTQCQAIDPG